MDNGRFYDFGLDTGTTFIDGASKETKLNYLKRHLANKTENELIKNLIPRSALFSA